MDKVIEQINQKISYHMLEIEKLENAKEVLLGLLPTPQDAQPETTPDERRRSVIELLGERKKPMASWEISNALGYTRKQVWNLMYDLKRHNRVVAKDGGYVLP